jgi:amino acid transporter/mannitol/fructose-specific phosphotransferase system IIA component (Ntr-type)
MPAAAAPARLKKELGLFDVFALSTGAMFSSGFFLLPGLAAARTGPSVFLAYLFAAAIIMPAMFSKAELSTALPRAGGTYFYLDRALGPLVGTVGGLGTYLALTLKTAFALIGIGAYAAFFVDLPIKPVAVALTVVFMILNIVGAKETTALQRWLVIVLLSVMALFVVKGLVYVGGQPVETTRERFSDFFAFGLAGFLSTIGFVFVSYAGLTKVASVAEEVRNPDRNLPLGMMLSLGVTAAVYAIGVFVIVAVVDAETLREDLTPVATATQIMTSWLPGNTGLLLVVIAALAAFASTGNAGMLAASRYPLAMARDHLIPPSFARLGRFRTPTPAILATGGLMIGCILVLDAEGIAKLASAFQLFIFILVNFAVIVMRESRIPSYDPGYRSPLYPWVQLFGMGTSAALIVYMGWQATLFTAGVVAICMLWYYRYAHRNPEVQRDGAIYHWFSRLGRRQYEGLDREFREIMKEKGLREDDPFDQIVAASAVLDVRKPCTFEEVVQLASQRLATRLPNTADELAARFLEGTRIGLTPVTEGVALPHFRTATIDVAEMVLVRAHHPIEIPSDDPLTVEIEPDRQAHAVFFLVSPDENPTQHLRILAQIAGRVDEDGFADAWRSAADEQQLREVLLRDERFVTIRIAETDANFAHRAIKDLDLPADCLIVMIVRRGRMVVPHGRTVLEPEDRITVIGAPADIGELRARMITARS